MMEIVAASAAGGLLAGLIALAVGGVGGQLQIRRAVKLLADQLGDTEQRIEREVKRRNGEMAPRRAPAATTADVLAELGVDPRAPRAENLSRAEIMRRGGL